MRQYNIFHAFFMSFFSRKFYRDVGENWRGIGYGYLFILALLVWIPTMLNGYLHWRQFTNNELPKIIEQLPQAVIKDGELSIDTKSPFFLRDPEKPNSIIAVFDTTGKYTDLSNLETNILFTKTAFFIRDKKSDNVKEIRYIDDDSLRNLDLSHDSINNFIDHYKEKALLLFFSVLYFVLVLLWFVYRMVQVLLYATVGIIFTKIVSNVKDDFGMLMRLTSVAITPAVIIGTALEFFPGHSHVPLLGYLGISLAYLFFAVVANKNSNQNV